MKESLKIKANNLIKSYNGAVVPINILYKLCDDNFYKRSNLERRLRQSESPNVTPVKKNGAIIGYKWSEKVNMGYTAEQFLREFPSPVKEPVRTLF